MAIRYKALTELYQETQRSVTAPDQWRAFLASACRNYRLSFDEQLLVYAQRPDATAVLEIERWNRQFGRWVNRGANGIAVFDGEHNGKPRLKYYFDISDTHEARFPRPVPLWTVREEYAPDIIETLENSFGELENKENLGEALLSTAKNAVEDNMPDYLSELKTLTEGSFLEELDELNLEVEYRRAVQNSIGYMLLVRCGLDPSGYFEDEDFRGVLNFNTPQTLNALGVATGDISQMCLSAISRTVLALQRQPQKENRTFEPQQKNQYAVTEQENTQPERSFEYDRDHLHQAGRLQSAEPSAAPGGAGSPWEIRIASEEVPQGAPQGDVHQPADQRQAEQPSGGDPADRPAPDGADRGADGQGSGRDGGTESQRPDEVGADDEQPAERGGGNGAGRADLQLNTPQDNRDIQSPSQGSQQMSLFDFGEAAPSKAYDLGYGHLGNGVTVWNRLEEEHGDYKTVAHIAPDRTVTIYDEDMAQAVREEIQRIADSSEMTISATQDAPVFTVPPRAQEPPQKEEPADPYPELAAQVLRFVGEFDGSRMDYGQDDAQAVENIAQQLHDPVQREEIRRLIQSFLDHADPEEEIAVDITLCMEQIAELPTALTPEQAQIEEIAGYLEEAGYAASSELVEEGLMDYRAHGGKGNSQDVADFIEREFLSEEPELASLEIAKEFINDFCVAEYGSPADFSDLEKVGIAYTTVTDEEIPIQVNADLVHYRIERYLDGQFLERRQYESLDELIQNELAELDFDDLISVSDGELESIGATPEQGSDGYFLLSRLKADCDYFLGAGGRAEKHLWAGNVREQIAKMRELYVALPDELEWLTMEDIDRYAQHMEPPFEVVVYHHFENGFDERLDYQTLAEAEQAAQKYVAGTMEGEDGFAYDGAGIYDLQENRWLRVYGNFPDERAIEQSAQALADEQQIENEPVQTNVEEPAVYEDLVGKELTMVGHRFVVERVSDVSDDVTLRDVTFEGNVGFPISRVEKVARVRELLQEQEQAQPQKEESLPPPPVGREKFSPTVLHPEISPEQRHNFRITDDHLGEGGAKTKFHNNVAAIQTLKQVEAEGRLATSEEQEILSRYVGWGGLPQAFDGDNSQWAEEFAELKGLLSPEEYEAAKATTLNAHYTSPTVIQAIYQAVENMGFRTGNFLEPSCGIGNFFGLVPESMKDSRLYGVELDSLTGRIAQQLYQQSSIAVQGFEDTELPDSFF